MALKFQLDQPVRHVAPVIEGKVVDRALVGDDVQFLVEYTDTTGETHKRWFSGDEIEAVPAAPAE